MVIMNLQCWCSQTVNQMLQYLYRYYCTDCTGTGTAYQLTQHATDQSFVGGVEWPHLFGSIKGKMRLAKLCTFGRWAPTKKWKAQGGQALSCQVTVVNYSHVVPHTLGVRMLLISIYAIWCDIPWGENITRNAYSYTRNLKNLFLDLFFIDQSETGSFWKFQRNQNGTRGAHIRG